MVTNIPNLKNYKVNPHREMYGWTSNNSIYHFQGVENMAREELDSLKPDISENP